MKGRSTGASGGTLKADEAKTSLPRWDLESIFPAVESPEFEFAFAELGGAIDATVEVFNQYGIGPERTSGMADSELVEAFEAVIRTLSEVQERAETIDSYLYAVSSVDSENEAAQKRMSEVQLRLVAIAKIEPRLELWLGGIDQEALLRDSAVAREHVYLLEQAKVRAQHLMPTAEEELAAELQLSGGSAWVRLYETYTSQIEAQFERDGETSSCSMAELRLLAYDADRDVRKRAYEAELATWESHAVPLAAALNGIKGEALTLLSRRKWISAIDQACFVNAIDREVLDAMIQAAEESLPGLRPYFAAKAKVLGLEQLTWFDLFAPLASSSASSWDYEQSTETVLTTFAGYSSRLRDLAERAFRERWIDVPPRAGKSDGAYCTTVKNGESRIMLNFLPSYSGMSTLAHELGHAYHTHVGAACPPLLRATPSTMAETASIFCETLMRHAALQEVDAAEELDILEGSLLDAMQTIVDILSRFQFERAVFEARRNGDLSITELCSLMRSAQIATYGDGLDPDQVHPYMWAAKGHYYDVSDGFYNFPYLFGLLFGLGLFSIYQQKPEGFAERYDELLAGTGKANARQLAERFGIDLGSIEFWRSALAMVQRDVDRYVELVDLSVGSGRPA